jgi:DNA-directed RNA polymerase subunit RPC12/RpoP
VLQLKVAAHEFNSERRLVMPIRFRCVHCGQLLGIAESKAGKEVDCPGCGRSIRVPAADGGGTPPDDAAGQHDPHLQAALSQLTTLGTGEPLTEPPQPVELSAPKLRSPGETATRPKPHSAATGDATEQLKPEPIKRTDSSPLSDRAAASDVAGHWADSIRELSAQAMTDAAPAAPVPHRHRLLTSGLVVSALLVGLVSGGSLVHVFSDRSRPSESAGTDDAQVDAAADPLPVPDGNQSVVEGSISWAAAGRAPAADAGALVLLLPSDRTSRWKLDARPLRSEAPTPDREALVAALQHLNASVQFADQDGHFRVLQRTSGPSQLVIISRHLNQSDAALTAQAQDALAHWFSNPAQLVGTLAAKTVPIEDSGNGDVPARIQIRFP